MIQKFVKLVAIVALVSFLALVFSLPIYWLLVILVSPVEYIFGAKMATAYFRLVDTYGVTPYYIACFFYWLLDDRIWGAMGKET